MRPKPLSSLHFGWLALMLATGLALRAWNLQQPVLFIDEAESAINAMTILEHGVPTDSYLGLPLFENTLVRPWPGHPEYEFRDVSYSEKGLVIYHGWLPLYAIAGSYALAGIDPDKATDPPRVQTTAEDMQRRTVAARMPAVMFGMGFLIAVYLAGRAMAGRDAALVATTLAALAPPAVRVARQARYYAPTQLLSLLCCLALWQMARRGRWRDFLWGGLAFALLFHTHVLTFAIACAVAVLVVPFMLGHRGIWLKLGTFAAINLMAILPWILWTGFPGEAILIPPARSLLHFPTDYAAYLVKHWKFSVALAAGVAWLGSLHLLRPHLPPRLVEPFAAPRRAVALLLVWMIAGYVAFLLLVPASSAFLWRLTLGVQGPGILFSAILIAAAAQVVMRRWGSLIAAALIGVTLLALPAVRRPLVPLGWREAEYELIEHLAREDFPAGARLYASPLHHLTLTLLTGLPVQATSPVRKGFFDNYPGEVVILETYFRGRSFATEEIRQAARVAGVDLSDEEAARSARQLRARPLIEELSDRGAQVEPGPEPLPAYLDALAARGRSEPPPREDPEGLWDNPAMFRGHETYYRQGFAETFFYRFVGPEMRRGDRLNYADRLRGARATVLPSTWVVFRSPADGEETKSTSMAAEEPGEQSSGAP